MDNDVEIDMEEQQQTEQEYVLDVFEMIKRIQNRKDVDFIYEEDFYFQMIPFYDNEIQHYYMRIDHPIAHMLRFNDYKEDACMFLRGEPDGTIVIYKGDYVDVCVQRMVQLCDNYKLLVIKKKC